MSLPIHVIAHSGYRANERPVRFDLDEQIYDIEAVEDRWYEPEAEYFKVRTPQGRRYLLRYNERADEWTLQSGFDGDELLARPTIELITVDLSSIRKAEQDRGLRTVPPGRSRSALRLDSRRRSRQALHVRVALSEMARRPNCGEAITEKTLVGGRGWDRG